MRRLWIGLMALTVLAVLLAPMGASNTASTVSAISPIHSRRIAHLLGLTGWGAPFALPS